MSTIPVSWIIVGVVSAILIVNLFKLMPRGRTRHVHRLREEARKLGYRVERQLEADKTPLLEFCMGYRQSLERCPLRDEFSCQRTDGGWQWLLGNPDDLVIQQVLEALPREVLRIDRQSFSVLVFWLEPQTLQPLLQLDQALLPLRAPQPTP